MWKVVRQVHNYQHLTGKIWVPKPQSSGRIAGPSDHPPEKFQVSSPFQYFPSTSTIENCTIVCYNCRWDDVSPHDNDDGMWQQHGNTVWKWWTGVGAAGNDPVGRPNPVDPD